MKITEKIEQIFATAVALDQSGGLRNTIYATGKRVYILNYDHTVLLTFRTEADFTPPISFKANDYDSNEFELSGGKIVFTSHNNLYTRKKTCGVGELTPEEIEALYKEYLQDKDDRQYVELSRDVLEMLDSSLSHIEFSGQVGEHIRMKQRNIYSGGVIEITKRESGQDTLLSPDELEQEFGPVAMKTSDFASLFAFNKSISLAFSNRDDEDYVLIRAGKMRAVVACCIYDEIVELKKSKADGRKKQKIRRSK